MWRSGWSNPVWYFSATSRTWYSWDDELLRQLLLPDARVHPLLGVGHAIDLVVLNGSGEGHERSDRVPLLLDVAVEALLVAHRLEPRARDHHRLCAPADLVPGEGVEVLHHHLGLLGDVVRVELEKPGQRARRLLALDVGIVLASLQEAVVGGVARVVGENIEDELFLDRLAHGVAMCRLAVPAEDSQGLVLRRRREGEKAQVRLPPPLGHAAEQLVEVVEPLLGGPLLGLLAKALAAEHGLQLGGRLAPLGAVRFVDDDRETPPREVGRPLASSLLGHLEEVIGDEGELLQGGDDDRYAAVERRRELLRVLVDLLDHAALVLELVDRVLELLIEHDAVGHDHDAVEDSPVRCVVK